MVCRWIHSVCSRLVGTVHIARTLSRGTFEFKCSYAVEDVSRQQPFCTHYERLCGYSLRAVLSPRTFLIPGSLRV
jgi:hypothetical protein